MQRTNKLLASLLETAARHGQNATATSSVGGITTGSIATALHDVI